MLGVLKQYLQDSSLIEMYFYSGENNKFCCGKVVSLDEYYFTFVSFDPYGRYDGYFVRRINDLCRINANSKYINSLINLIDNDFVEHIKFDSYNEIIPRILHLSIDNGKAVSIEIADSDSLIIGIVSSVEDEKICINNLNEYGEPDGISIVFLEDIISVSYDSLDERKIERLYNSFQNK